VTVYITLHLDIVMAQDSTHVWAASLRRRARPALETYPGGGGTHPVPVRQDLAGSARRSRPSLVSRPCLSPMRHHHGQTVSPGLL